MSIQKSLVALVAAAGVALVLATPHPGIAWQAEREQNQPATAAENYDLSPATVRKLERDVIPALLAGNNEAFMETLGAIIQRAQPGDLDEIERFGNDHGAGSLKTEFGNRFLQLVEQGAEPRSSSLRLPVVLFLNQFLIERVEFELAELDSHAVMHRPLELPDTWRGNEQLFWEVHVFENRLANVIRLVEHFIVMNQPHFDRASRKGDDATILELQPVGELPDRIRTAVHTMQENEAELRLLELERAEATLRESTDFATRLAAAFALEMDAGALREFFENVDPSSLTRSRLTSPNIGQQIAALIESGRKHGEDVIEKAVLLRTGAHWWLRGRYGLGPLAWGLLKRPEALLNEQAMFGLYMPKSRPEPVGWTSDDGSISPGYDRRHYYTWALEYREMTAEFRQSTSKTENTRLEPTGKRVFW